MAARALGMLTAFGQSAAAAACVAGGATLQAAAYVTRKGAQGVANALDQQEGFMVVDGRLAVWAPDSTGLALDEPVPEGEFDSWQVVTVLGRTTEDPTYVVYPVLV